MRGAPTRESLMDAGDRRGPRAAPPIVPPQPVEWARVDKRRPPVMLYLRRSSTT
jgi:hypothetical protein